MGSTRNRLLASLQVEDLQEDRQESIRQVIQWGPLIDLSSMKHSTLRSAEPLPESYT